MPLVAEPLGYITSVGPLVAIVEGVSVGIGRLDRIAGAQRRLYELPCAELPPPLRCREASGLIPGSSLFEFPLVQGAQCPESRGLEIAIMGKPRHDHA